VDLSLSGRVDTWYRGYGFSMSRLDRFLLSENLCMKWSNNIQVAQQRGLSVLVPLLLSVDSANWGPQPLRRLKCLDDFLGYKNFVRDKTGSYQI
jgi:hypothetical protein